MKFRDEDFSYYLTEDMKREYLIGLKQYFTNYITDFDDNISRFINTKVIGTLMFELLQREDIEYSKNTQRTIEYIKFYLERCLESEEYCCNKVFIPCAREAIGLHLPPSDIIYDKIYTIEQLCDYTIIHADSKKKTDIIFANKDNIEYSKIYHCKKIEDLFIASLFELFGKGYTIRKCKNCGKFFVTVEKGKRIKYCYNISPQDQNKTCRDFFSQATYSERRRQSLRRTEYARLYNRFNNRINRFERKTEEQKEKEDKDLAELKDIYFDMKEQLKLGTVTEAEICEYLQSYENGGKEKWQSRN